MRLAEFVAAQLVRANVRSKLKPILSDMPPLRVAFSDSVAFPYDVLIERNGVGYDLVLSKLINDPGRSVFKDVARRVHTMFYWHLQASEDVQATFAHLSDGDHFGDAGFYFSTNMDDRTALPDHYFFTQRGFQSLREEVRQTPVVWADRAPDIMWRGGLNGNGYKNVLPDLIDHPTTCQRLRMAWKCRDSEIDFGFLERDRSYFHPSLKSAGFLRDRVDAAAWRTKKFAIDIDGFSNTWDNLFHRLLMGCCVLKVGSDFGFRQWYYEDLQPWEHFVPVRSDLSDLHEKVAWVRDHDSQAKGIADNGQALAMSLTFESQSAVAGKLIEENWRRYI